MSYTTITRTTFASTKIAYRTEAEFVDRLNEIIMKGHRIHKITYPAVPEATDTRHWAEVYYARDI